MPLKPFVPHHRKRRDNYIEDDGDDLDSIRLRLGDPKPLPPSHYAMMDAAYARLERVKNPNHGPSVRAAFTFTPEEIAEFEKLDKELNEDR